MPVVACDGEVIPFPPLIETVADEAELEEVHDTERHLLCVASTRARDHLLATGVRPWSPPPARATRRRAGPRAVDGGARLR